MRMMKYDEESFLKEILSISSVNGADSERNAAVFIKDFLQECGVQAGLQEIDGRRANVVAVLCDDAGGASDRPSAEKESGCHDRDQLLCTY